MASSLEDIAKQAAEAVVDVAYSKMKRDFNDILLREEAVDEKEQKLAARDEKLNEKEEKLVQRESNVIDYQKEGRGLAVDILRRERKVRDAKQDMEEREAKLTEREWVAIRREREYEEAQEDLAESKKKAERFRNSYNLANEHLSAASRKTEKLEKRVAALEIEKKRYQTAFAEQAKRSDQTLEREMSQNTKLTKKVDELRADTLDLTGMNAELNERVAFLEKENARLRRLQEEDDPTPTKNTALKVPRKSIPATYQPTSLVSRPGYAQSTFSSRCKTASPALDDPQHLVKKASLPGLSSYSDGSPTVTVPRLRSKGVDEHAESMSTTFSRLSSLHLPAAAISDQECQAGGTDYVDEARAVHCGKAPTIEISGGEYVDPESASPALSEVSAQPKRTLTPGLRQALHRATFPTSNVASTLLLGSSPPLYGFPAPPTKKPLTFQEAMRKSSRWISQGRSISAPCIEDFHAAASMSTRSVSGGVALSRKAASSDLREDLLQFTPTKSPSSAAGRKTSSGVHGYAPPSVNDEDADGYLLPARGNESSARRPGSRMTEERYQRLKEMCRTAKAQREEQQQGEDSEILSGSFV